MLQKFKIAFYALIVGLVLVSNGSAQTGIPDATSCKGWNCSIEGQICPQGVPGASAGNFICTNSKWVQMLDVPAQKPVDNIAKATSCKGWNCSIEGQICPQGVPGASDGSYICENSKWVLTGDAGLPSVAAQDNIGSASEAGAQAAPAPDMQTSIDMCKADVEATYGEWKSECRALGNHCQRKMDPAFCCSWGDATKNRLQAYDIGQCDKGTKPNDIINSRVSSPWNKGKSSLWRLSRMNVFGLH